MSFVQIWTNSNTLLLQAPLKPYKVFREALADLKMFGSGSGYSSMPGRDEYELWPLY